MDSITTLKPDTRLFSTWANMTYQIEIGISHLPISGIVIHGRCCISHSFYFSVVMIIS